MHFPFNHACIYMKFGRVGYFDTLTHMKVSNIHFEIETVMVQMYGHRP